MKEINFLEMFDENMAEELINYVYDGRFCLNLKDNFIQDCLKDKKTCLVIPVIDSHDHMATEIYLQNKKIAVIGVNDLNVNKKYQSRLIKGMYQLFGKPYKKFLYKEIDKELEI